MHNRSRVCCAAGLVSRRHLASPSLVPFACALLLACVACEESRPPLHLVAPELDTPPAPSRPGARARAGAPCTGHSDDPPTATLEAAVSAAVSGSTAAYAELLALAIAWPQSATVRVRAADAAGEPGDALRLYADAVRMHDAACTLAPPDLQIALHGLGAGRLSAGDLPGARAAFARAVETFPQAAPTRYGYAATLCRLHQLEPCVVELVTALSTDDAIALQRLAARDPDFAAVRANPLLRPLLAQPR